MKKCINHNQSLYSIVIQEINHFIKVEDISIEAKSIDRITDLFFQTIGLKAYTNMDQLAADILEYIKIPIIVAKEYSKIHNHPDERLIKKTIDSMQTRIKEHMSHPPIFHQ